jgi:hypothetical protein
VPEKGEANGSPWQLLIRQLGRFIWTSLSNGANWPNTPNNRGDAKSLIRGAPGNADATSRFSSIIWSGEPYERGHKLGPIAGRVARRRECRHSEQMSAIHNSPLITGPALAVAFPIGMVAGLWLDRSGKGVVTVLRSI